MEWPVRKCISAKALEDLIKLQKKTYGTKLDLIEEKGDIESLEEIAEIMKEPPVWYGD